MHAMASRRQRTRRLSSGHEHHDHAFKRHLMVCVIMSVVTLIAACNEQDPRSYCVKLPPRSPSHDPGESDWRCTKDGESRVRFANGAPVVHVQLQLPPSPPHSSAPKVVQVVHHGGWSSTNTLLHVLACASCLGTAMLLKNRAGPSAAVVWSGSLMLFLMAIATDMTSFLAWRQDCSVLGLVLADDVANSVLRSGFTANAVASALQSVTTECHPWPRMMMFGAAFAATGCLCGGNIVFALVHFGPTQPTKAIDVV